jgi:tRNA(fMet)-specific endonuclease VapC
MPEYMLDTDTVSFALRGHGRVAARLLEHRPSQLCISSIALAELRVGAEARRSRKLHRLVSTFVESVEVVPFDQAATDRFATVATSLTRRGVPIGTFDTLMAAHALSLGLTFVTNNPALRASRRTQDRKLRLKSWAAEQQA